MLRVRQQGHLQTGCLWGGGKEAPPLFATSHLPRSSPDNWGWVEAGKGRGQGRRLRLVPPTSPRSSITPDLSAPD